jgi:anaerobic selenocysteine-containing dehydrogenase
VIDEFITDTAREADIILPSKTFFEQSDLITAYWHSYLQFRQKVLDPPGDVRPETEIYWQLGKRLGYTDLALEKAGIPRPGESEALLKEALEQVNQEHGSALSLERLAARPLLAPGTQEIAFDDLVFATPSGKIELFSEEAVLRWGVDPLPRWSPPLESALRSKSSRYPLQMLTPNIKNSIHSQFNNLSVIRQFDPGPLLSMHPGDALQRGLTWMLVRLFNDRGGFLAPWNAGSRRAASPARMAIDQQWWGTTCPRAETDMGHVQPSMITGGC